MLLVSCLKTVLYRVVVYFTLVGGNLLHTLCSLLAHSKLDTTLTYNKTMKENERSKSSNCSLQPRVLRP